MTLIPALLLLAWPSDASAAIRPWDGEFTTNFGTLTFKQRGTVVTASYPWSGGGRLTGRATGPAGRVLRATYRDASGPGTFVVTLNPRLRTFSGPFRGQNGQTGRWTGRRVGKVEIRFRAQAYANNVRVVAPLVGRFQLGVARWNGQGTLGPGAPFAGTVVDTDQLRFPRSSHRISMTVDNFNLSTNGPAVILTLTVRVLASNQPTICPVGTVGTVRLIDDPRLLPQGIRQRRQTRDGIAQRFPLPPGPLTAPRGGPACPTHVQGWNNTDGGPRTSPQYGGFPNGGQRAKVTINVS